MSTQGTANRDKIARAVANKLDVPTQKVKEAVKYQFRFLARTMKEGDFNSVRLPYFGLFHVKDGRVEALEKKSSSSSED